MHTITFFLSEQTEVDMLASIVKASHLITQVQLVWQFCIPFLVVPKSKQLQCEHVSHCLISWTYSQKGPSVHQRMHLQGWEVEVQRVEKYSEQATLRDSVLAFREDNDSAESTTLSAWSILQTLQGNKDKWVQQSFLSCMSHLAYTFILSFWRFLDCFLSHSFSQIIFLCS